MGRVVRELGEGVTKYYWYPGQKSDWIKSGICVAAGGAVFLLCYVITKNELVAAVFGASVTCGVGGVYLGRRDVGALSELHDMVAERRAAVVDAGRAAWRATVQGFVVAASAVFVLNMPHEGFIADWVLPVVPALVGAIAHSGGMLYERMNQVAKDNAMADRGEQSEADAEPRELEPAG
ncbi:hypothetical protein [Stackebrandtia nassauensis]|uniref:Uncharacterized protein n=1 Tax=Stackebrandtia nassauensis (strain DSM 44728 / CIP 108903 / NRRL B-16338 / NBRC 102104 / LLR-40K-21) TaxID=446470 RepID=D3QAV7_STANL|nr:hypothetical protein [Stackebrandtia nassauensis]ADD44753.1 hypothetical protein Snas_5118 [Stackebrandtia nassauensis DSM 44728]